MTTTQKDWTINEVIIWTQDYFSRQGINEARLEAELLLARVIGCSRLDLYLRFQELLSAKELSRYRELIQIRKTHKPLAYILGERDFFGLTFQLNDQIFIPRPETEQLVETVLEYLKADKSGNSSSPGYCLADLGCGCGNIAIALSRSLSEAERTYAIDISSEALKMACVNAQHWGVTERVIFLQGDFFQALHAYPLRHCFRAVVSNPPYIQEGEFSQLSPEVQQEPRESLLAGPDGLIAIKSIINNAPEFLTSGGYLFLEIGYNQGEPVSELLRQRGFSLQEIRRDYNGLERIAVASWPG